MLGFCEHQGLTVTWIFREGGGAGLLITSPAFDQGFRFRDQPAIAPGAADQGPGSVPRGRCVRGPLVDQAGDHPGSEATDPNRSVAGAQHVGQAVPPSASATDRSASIFSGSWIVRGRHRTSPADGCRPNTNRTRRPCTAEVCSRLGYPRCVTRC
jgi:hypothetical protein